MVRLSPVLTLLCARQQHNVVAWDGVSNSYGLNKAGENTRLLAKSQQLLLALI